MTEAELIQLILAKRNELKQNRLSGVSRSLLRLQEEELEELEYIYVSGDQKRLEMRRFLDLCAAKYDIPA